MEEKEFLNLQNLHGGAALELFDIELQRVLENILDVNTSPGAREITLRIKIIPNERRDEIGIEIYPDSKMGKRKAISTAAYVGRQGGKGAVAQEIPKKQIPLFDNITSMNQETGGQKND